MAYEFDQFTLAESGGSSPAGPTLNYSPGFSGPLSPATYVPTPAAAGGPPPSSSGQSAIFDGGRSLGLESFQNRGYLDNLTQWRLETRIHNFTNGSVLSTGGYTISISPAPNPILYFTDYNLDRGAPIG